MSKFTMVGHAGPDEGKMRAFDSDGLRVAVANSGGRLYAFDDTCTHLGCSLAQGHLEGTTLTCRCHGSQFNIATGEVLRGPAARPIRSYEVQLKDGAVEVAI